MQRPLVWVGVAYMAGECWAAAAYPPAAGCIFILVIMILAGRYRQEISLGRLFYMLPVFFMSGFVAFSHASEASPDMGWISEILDERDSADVSFCGRVTAWEEKENTVALTLTSAEISDEKQGKTGTAGVLIYLDKDEAVQPGTGDRIAGRGQLETPEEASNPGQFDAAGYYQAKGIDYLLWPEDIEIITHSPSFRNSLQQFRERLAGVYEACLTEDEAGVMKAILLGDKTMLSEDTKELYRRVGISHVLAISGLHISMVGMGLFKMLKKLGLELRTGAGVAALLVLAYGVMTGFSTSTERAVIMFVVSMGAVYLGRAYDMLSALSLAALIIFIRLPLMITQAGVQFSFGAVLSIGVLWPSMRKIILGEDYKNRSSADAKKKWFVQMLDFAGPSSAVTLGTLPLTAWYYGEIPLISVFLNLAVLPLMGVLVPLGLAAGLAGLFFSKAALFLSGAVHYMLLFNDGLCCLAQKLPFSLWRTGVPPVSWVIGYYVLLILFVVLAGGTKGKGLLRRVKISWLNNGAMKMKIAEGRSSGKMLLLLLLMSCFILIPVRRMTPMVAFLDVGQGDCIFIRTPSGHVWLVDGGSTDVKAVGQYRIMPFLAYYGEYRADYVCVTHGDEDHLSGIRELLEADRVGHLILTTAEKTDEACAVLAELAKERAIPVSYVRAGDGWTDGGWQFNCLYPDDTVDSDTDKNDQSMVLRLQAAGVDFLLTGDLSENGEQRLNAAQLAGTEVLKVGHHGSGSSSSQPFLENTGARLAIISCGKNNRYGHPSGETLERLRAAGMDIRLTTEEGAILMLHQKAHFIIQGWKSKR